MDLAFSFTVRKFGANQFIAAVNLATGVVDSSCFRTTNIDAANASLGLEHWNGYFLVHTVAGEVQFIDVFAGDENTDLKLDKTDFGISPVNISVFDDVLYSVQEGSSDIRAFELFEASASDSMASLQNLVPVLARRDDG